MAKMKREVVIGTLMKANDGHYYASMWANASLQGKILAIEGVSRVEVTDDVRMTAHIDPRYDENEVVAEIESTLNANLK